MTGSMKSGRYGVEVVDWLPNGQTVVAGGQNNTGYLSSSKLYDPASGVWTLQSP